MNGNVIFVSGQVRQAHPNETASAGDSVAHLAALGPAGANVTIGSAVLVSGIFDKYRVTFAIDPVSRQIGDVVYMRVLVVRNCLLHSFAGFWLAEFQLGDHEVRFD